MELATEVCVQEVVEHLVFDGAASIEECLGDLRGRLRPIVSPEPQELPDRVSAGVRDSADVRDLRLVEVVALARLLDRDRAEQEGWPEVLGGVSGPDDDTTTAEGQDPSVIATMGPDFDVKLGGRVHEVHQLLPEGREVLSGLSGCPVPQ